MWVQIDFFYHTFPSLQTWGILTKFCQPEKYPVKLQVSVFRE